MPQQTMISANLSLEAGKHTQPPNTVLVPAGRKRFPLTVVWSLTSAETYVLASHDQQAGHEWCLLDAKLRQVQSGNCQKQGRVPKACLSHASRAVHGGGAGNHREVQIELASAKLKHGQTYTLLCRHYGVLATLDFVAVHPPKPSAKRKPASKRGKGKAKAPKKAVAKAVKKSAKKTAKRKGRAA